MNSRLDELTAQSTWTDAEIAEYEGLFAEQLHLDFFTSLATMLRGAIASRFFHFLSHNP